MQKQTEQWRDINGYEGLYQASDEGRVKSLRFGKEKILKARDDGHGYFQVGLFKDGKQVFKRVHRLVAEAFLPNPNNYKEINHKDEDKTNNSVENLEWCDRKYNINYGTGVQRRAEKQINDPKRSKRVDQIDMVSGEVIRQWASTAECGRNGYDQGAVSRCARGKLKQFKGYVWKYIQA
jgi:hypothetical protein